MNQGAITSSIDVAQVTLYLFWFFFAGLLYYLRREDKHQQPQASHVRTTNNPVAHTQNTHKRHTVQSAHKHHTVPST